MERSVACWLHADIAGHCDIVLSIAAARGASIVSETLTATIDGAVIELEEVDDDHGVRLHRANAVRTGHLGVQYQATVTGRAAPPVTDAIDLVRYTRPSRYCESDRIAPFARGEFGGLQGHQLLDAVTRWVGRRVEYVAGSSRPIDGAVATLLARQGVCRDFAHLVVALLRGCDTPARLVSVYAPGLSPMDFHAVAEAYVDGQWYAADATGLAPRSEMLRIATGRDAADTAFLTVAGDSLTLVSLEVFAVTDDDLPVDHGTQLVQLS
jgi:transglutaminase-like putative cysteine protease